jgi:L-ascorbate metabolism protein UlaG (beta-lactamase superfamily)
MERKAQELAMTAPRMTLIGGPTLLIELGGYRLLTDPTFDGPGEYRLPYTVLKKTAAPAVAASEIGTGDAVLLSHDQHFDNLDHSGRDFLASAHRVITTVAAAGRLGGNAEGLAPWQSKELAKDASGVVQVTASPARHGPAGIEPLSGDVIGFVLTLRNDPMRPVYITGDTVWFEGVAEVARRFRPGTVVLFAGAAQTRGPFHLTMDVNDAIEAAHAFADALIVPAHCDAWAHLTQDRDDLKKSFDILGVGSRLRLLEPGVATVIG